MPYDNPYEWTDVNGDEHSLETHCNNQETAQECQTRHDAGVVLALDLFPPAE